MTKCKFKLKFDLGNVMNLIGFLICIVPNSQISYSDSCISGISLAKHMF